MPFDEVSGESIERLLTSHLGGIEKGRPSRGTPFSDYLLAKFVWVNLLTHTDHLFLIHQIDSFALICDEIHNSE